MRRPSRPPIIHAPPGGIYLLVENTRTTMDPRPCRRRRRDLGELAGPQRGLLTRCGRHDPGVGLDGCQGLAGVGLPLVEFRLEVFQSDLLVLLRAVE